MAAIEIFQDDPGYQHQHQHPSRDTSHGRSSFETSPKPAAKRLFSNRSLLSDQTNLSENYAEDEGNDMAEDDYPSGKRYRSSEWPLTNASPNGVLSARNQNRGRGLRKSPPRRSTSAQARASRFLEGSMNDRVSQKPPATYIGDDEDMRENYERERSESRLRGRSRKFTYHPNPSIAQSSATDASRNSSIFRFGKSLAASFNPTNWKIWSKDAKQEIIYETDQQRDMRERQEKAVKIYQEMKTSGYFHDGAHSSNLQRTAENIVPPRAKHDSGVEFGRRSSSLNGRMTTAEKRMGRVFVDSTPVPKVPRGETPGSVTSASSPRKSFQFKKPSLPNIRKSLDLSCNTPDYGSDDPSVRKIPSRKDLQKQQKLVKRVSDLEGKLEAARRQLTEVMGEPLPLEPIQIRRGRSHFVPGALATLPSERLLSGYVSDDGGLSDDGAMSEIGKAVTVEKKVHASRAESVSSPKKTFQNVAARMNTPMDTQATKEIGEGFDRSGETHSSYAGRAQNSASQSGPVANNYTGRLPWTDKPLPQLNPLLKEHTKPQPKPDVPRNSIESDSPVHMNPRPTRQLSKKRKSTAADDGIYRPPSESDEDFKPVKKKTPPKKKARKLEKTAPEPPSTPELRKPVQEKQRDTISRFNPPKKSASTLNKLTKVPRKSTPAQQSASPPPSSHFTGLDYPKPTDGMQMGSPDREKVKNVLRDDEEPYSAIPGTEFNVPPMPKLPKTVRLPSGEVVNTMEAAKTKEKQNEAELRKSVDGSLENSEVEKPARSKQSFEWERDTF